MTASAPRSPWVSGLNTEVPDIMLEDTTTGQPGLRFPVSTFREKMRFSTVRVVRFVVAALNKSDRDGKSTTGVPEMPKGAMLPHEKALDGAGGATFVCQTTLPLM